MAEKVVMGGEFVAIAAMAPALGYLFAIYTRCRYVAVAIDWIARIRRRRY